MGKARIQRKGKRKDRKQNIRKKKDYKEKATGTNTEEKRRKKKYK